MKSKSFAFFAIAVMSLTSLAACGGTTNGGSSKSPSDIHVGFVSATTNANFAVEMAMGAQYAANQYHVTAQIVAPTSVDGPAEVKMFQDLTKTATDGIGVMTLAPDLFVRPESDAIKSGIPVVAVDTIGLPGSGVTTYVGNDNVAAGALLADEAIRLIPANAKGSVVIGNPQASVPPLNARVDGIKQEFAAKRPDLTVIGPLLTNQDPTQNYNTWNNIVKAHPEALAFLEVGDPGNSSLARIKQANNGKYLTGAFDLDEAGIQAVVNGTNFGFVDPEHFLKGYIAMRLLIEHALHGTAIPTGWWNPGAQLITQANIQQIITRQQSLDSRGEYFKSTIDTEFANQSAYIKPYSAAE
jgi:ribose transport system substrate-binding protein